jgi:adenylate cyclase
LANERLERRLAAVLAADIAGYSRLIGADEEGTLARLRTLRRELIDPAITEHRGRLVKTTGDGILVEFASTVDALRCASAIQETMAARNAGLAGEHRIEFRIGIHQGDIVVEDGDIFGDGVNIAARLEALAEPGGICVSRRVQEDADGRLDLAFEDIGQQSLKNIARPVRVFRVALARRGASALSTASRSAADAEPFARRTGDGDTPALALPDKPSLAVLPFQNMSGNPEQEYFADGVVEDITAALCRVRDFFVIARNSAFIYKGRAVSAQQVSQELGVRYLIEGSVRNAGNRLRITAQLIDAPSGNHIWANRYEGLLTDIFELQDRITESVVGFIQPSIRTAEIERSHRKRPESLDAYDFVLRAYPGVWSLERSASAEALNLLGQAIAIEPGYPLALALAAWCHAQQSVYTWAPEPAAARAEALRLAQAAAAASGEDPTVVTVLGAAHTLVGNHAAAARFLERALALDPNSAWACNRSGWLHAYLGDADLSIKHFERALRLSPFDPMNFNVYVGIGAAHFAAGRLEEAALWQERGLLERPGATWVYRNLVAIHALLGRHAEAQAGLAKLLAEYPGLTIRDINSAIPAFRPSQERWGEGLRLAGMPE